MVSNDIEDLNTNHSAVVVLHDLQSDSLILTKRSEHLRYHPGEVCFPGGYWEEGDENYYATALRELNEELGIDHERVTLIRELEAERTLRGAIIHPWYVSIDCIEPYKLNFQEVAKILFIPMQQVKNLKNYKDIWVQRNQLTVKTMEFVGQDEYIWGATVRIMRQLATA